MRRKLTLAMAWRRVYSLRGESRYMTDKRGTIRCQDGVVHDHVTGRRWALREYERGAW